MTLDLAKDSCTKSMKFPMLQGKVATTTKIGK